MLVESNSISAQEFESNTGWKIKPEGACKGDICIPLTSTRQALNLEALASAMKLPIAAEPTHNLWALGPESISGTALTTADAIDFELPDVNGKPFRLSSQKGKKIVVYAWAPY